MRYGIAPTSVGTPKNLDLKEVMYYLYLPVFMEGSWSRPSVGKDIKLPDNVECCLPVILDAMEDAESLGKSYRYVYLSARKGWATRDNPLNRPGWHCDGFGTDDLNYVWWKGEGTRFALQEFENISDDHIESLRQFEEQVKPDHVWTPAQGDVYRITPHVVHATPIHATPGWRQYVKVSLSNHRYNLENNSHNYLFDYEWPLHSREDTRNDTDKGQRDYA